ncbi:MAG: ATP-dependent RNA helicase HrpA [Smithella sp.]|nr:ATP-dependent RNA helicase HrpA [Smithella sp.]HOU49645.1 ATP-dependent RNA helicase HrpA [Smithella sp.]
MQSIKNDIRQIRQKLDSVMIADYYRIVRELKNIETHRANDEKSAFRKLGYLKKLADLSTNRYRRRKQNAPSVHFPQNLPIIAKKREIIESIQKHQVTIITGETGSGKTTQIPKMCLAAGLGLRGMIGLTQPRRIAAISMAHRIASELGEECGQSVAYKIRFEEKSSAEPFIKVMTDGILLAETVKDRDLLAYDTLIVDEAHERSLNIDFILGYLRTLLARRKDLKVIITSATIDTEKFSEAFNKAPVIKVSGRMYPVEVRYRPVDPEKEEKGETTYIDEAVACVEQLQRERRYEDILIFMPTEQDIRETCGLLSKKCSGLVLPLYARLSGSQQRLIFAPVEQQKIIVATNIAETSLTIPGIKYVIDSGLARILEYNPRSQTTGLPIKPISASSAEQRKGRCGRVQNGICIRLYSQEEFSQKPLYTPPEIMRSNLAGVILRMLELNLGAVTSFPFIDKPQPKSIRDGIDILRDLGALIKDDSAEETNQYMLTETGRRMAEFPLDPRASRMMIEAQKENCVNEIAVIAAALSIQDPRERPYEKADEASKAHAQFAHPESDFLTYLNIWNRYHGSLENLPTQNKQRKFCRDHFLSYKRMIEWRDIYHQILDILDGKNKAVKNRKHHKIEINQDIADRIHRCILSGYLSNIARKKEKNFYTAAKSREVMIYPGSGLFNRAGQWIVAAEISMTSRVFARHVANIQSDWLEKLGGDNCRYTYAAAHWEKNRGQVVALEKVTLFGLTIVESRPVAYEKINPEEAKAIFIREALVTGEVSRRIPFLEHNLSLYEHVQTMEEKLRRRGIVADEETIANLYEQRLPVLSDIRSLQNLIKEKGSDEFLRFREEDLIVHEPDEEEISQYPDQIKIGDAAFNCLYNFEPGKKDDGVTVKVPLGFLSKAATENIDHHLPSLLKEKAVHLLKTLPKSIRLKLPPPAQVTQLLLEDQSSLNKPLPQALSQLLLDQFKIKVSKDDWATEKLPDYLNIRYSVIDEKGNEIKDGRDINLLQKELADSVSSSAMDKIRGECEKEGITGWDFGELPQQIPLRGAHGLIGYAYPALTVVDGSINLRLFSSEKQSAFHHPRGVAALYDIHFADLLKQLKKNIALNSSMKAIAANIGPPKQLEQSIINRVNKDLFFRPWRRREEFIAHAGYLKSQILPYGQQVLTAIEPVLKAFDDTYNVISKLMTRNRGNNPVLNFLKGIRTELSSLVPIDFPELYTFERMKELPRYCRALALRAERGSLNLASAEKKLQEAASYTSHLMQILNENTSPFPSLDGRGRGRVDNDQSTQVQQCIGFKKINRLQEDVTKDCPEEKKSLIEELFWMIEEYKVSLFAQELKTPYHVSPKKLNQLIEEIEKF